MRHYILHNLDLRRTQFEFHYVGIPYKWGLLRIILYIDCIRSLTSSTAGRFHPLWHQPSCNRLRKHYYQYFLHNSLVQKVFPMLLNSLTEMKKLHTFRRLLQTHFCIVIFLRRLSEQRFQLHLNVLIFRRQVWAKCYGTLLLCIGYAYNWYLLKAYDLENMLDTNYMCVRCIGAAYRTTSSKLFGARETPIAVKINSAMREMKLV